MVPDEVNRDVAVAEEFFDRLKEEAASALEPAVGVELDAGPCQRSKPKKKSVKLDKTR